MSNQDKEISLTGGVRGTWVQTERAAHEAWAALIGRKPKAAQLLHLMVANMNRHGAIIVSQKTLAEMMGVSVKTIYRSVLILQEENWIDVVRVGSERGGVCAYVVNRRVAWADKRERQQYAAFDARVVASASEQPQSALENQEPLRELPRLGEGQIPFGPGLEPPSQQIMGGFEPDLPAFPEGDSHLQDPLPLD